VKSTGMVKNPSLPGTLYGVSDTVGGVKLPNLAEAVESEPTILAPESGLRGYLESVAAESVTGD